VIGGFVGLLVVIIASEYVSYVPYSLKGIDWGEVALSGGTIGLFAGGITLGIIMGKEEGILSGIASSVCGAIGGFIMGAIAGLIIVAIAPILLGIICVVATEIMIGVVTNNIKNLDDIWYLFEDPLMIGGVITGIIISGIAWGLESRFIANAIFIPPFAVAGYGTGKRIGEIIAKKEELEQKINDYKTKIEQWGREGYEVSGLKEIAKMKDLSLIVRKLKEYEGKIQQLKQAEKILNETKDNGMIITGGEELLIKSKQALDNGDYRSAGKLSVELKNLVNDIEKKYREAKDRLKSAKSILEMARKIGCDVSEAEQLLSRAISEFERGNYVEAISDASRSEEVSK